MYPLITSPSTHHRIPSTPTVSNTSPCSSYPNHAGHASHAQIECVLASGIEDYHVSSSNGGKYSTGYVAAKCEPGYTALWCNCHSAWSKCGSTHSFKPDDSGVCAVNNVQAKGAVMRVLCARKISSYDGDQCAGDDCLSSVGCKNPNEVRQS